MADRVYELRITLCGTKPAIWRRVAVPAEITLAKLDRVIQTVMGWTNSHLHMFMLGAGPRGQRQCAYGRELRRFSVPEWGLDAEDERKVALCELCPEVKSTLGYIYDLGDEWEHLVEVEVIHDAQPGVSYPLCLDGARAGPPEDCGGVGGYYEMLEALEDPKHDRHKEMVEWIESFDPEPFDRDEVNRLLARLRKRVPAARSSRRKPTDRSRKS